MASALRVSLLQHTPSPDRTVAAAGRLCYAPVSAANLQQELSDEEVRRMLRTLVETGHHSALEHASFTFAVDGISRACSHQLVRHRLASYSQQSQRWVRFGDRDSFVVPPQIEGDPVSQAIFLEAMDHARVAYERLIARGRELERDQGGIQEDARFVLPNAAETRIVVTMNARELRHFFSLRCCRRAQWEIRGLAWAMRRLVLGVSPLLFEATGPGCLHGVCPEGPYSCGEPYTQEEVAGLELVAEADHSSGGTVSPAP